MVENEKSCVLQQPGHARYITERFSELLAREALVDVTLVCEEQKLRVHKLVLASNSTYFEDILQQDLGQEPIIFLKDLNFEILKAMIEFMYCGETTIPYQLLSPLLTATKNFKVKELTTVVNAVMSSNTGDIATNMEKKLNESEIMNDTNNSTDCMHINGHIIKNECSVLHNESNRDVNLSEIQSLEENRISETPEKELDRMLYEESHDFEINTEETNTLFSVANAATLAGSSWAVLTNGKMKEVSNRCLEDKMINNHISRINNETKPTLYEQCCDFLDTDECEENSMSLSQSCLQQIEKDFAQYKFGGTDVPNKVGKCVKVYTHKRRKSIDEIKTKITDVNNIIQSTPSTDCIDLLDEPSTDDIPLTLLTSLDMESAEYIISLSTENIQTIVGATLTDQKALDNTRTEIEQIINYNAQKETINKKESSIESTDTSNCTKPILRRSSRLNQHDIEEIADNNETVRVVNGKEKHFKKSYSSNRTELCIKRKRKIKDVGRKVSEQSINSVMQSNRKAFNSSRRNHAKLILKRSNKCTMSSKEKGEQTVKTANKIKHDISEATEVDSIFAIPQLNTIEHISRALWGDMSDFPEDFENRFNALEYTPNTEIPFAVGLLPLRTALEKMQATPDYQPRKTRSSVAPTRQGTNCFKRKNFGHFGKITDSKMHNTCVSDPKGNAKAVCHIQIRTAPPQYVRNRKKYLTADVNRLEPPAIINKH